MAQAYSQHREQLQAQLEASNINAKIAKGCTAAIRNIKLDPKLCVASALIPDDEVTAALDELNAKAAAGTAYTGPKGTFQCGRFLESKLVGSEYEEPEEEVDPSAAPPEDAKAYLDSFGLHSVVSGAVHQYIKGGHSGDLCLKIAVLLCKGVRIAMPPEFMTALSKAADSGAPPGSMLKASLRAYAPAAMGAPAETGAPPEPAAEPEPEPAADAPAEGKAAAAESEAAAAEGKAAAAEGEAAAEEPAAE